MHHYSPMRMPPNHHFIMNTLPVEPVSRTYQYRKIMKPMLERKRRARINKCLDELKDLMTGTLQADGENVSKLEKADILELTVRHLHRLRENNALFLDPAAMGSAAPAANNSSPNASMEKFWAGFQQCASEVFQFMHKYDQQLSGNLLQHISGYMPSAKPPPPPALPSAGNSMDYQRLFAPVKMERFDNEQNISPLGESVAHRPHPYQRPMQLERHRNKDYEPECGAGVWRPW